MSPPTRRDHSGALSAACCDGGLETPGIHGAVLGFRVVVISSEQAGMQKAECYRMFR